MRSIGIRLWAAAVLLGALAHVTGCGSQSEANLPAPLPEAGSDTGPAGPAANRTLPHLPPPAELVRGSSALSDNTLDGRDFVAGRSQHAAIDGTGALLTPSYSAGAGLAPDNLAFAVYLLHPDPANLTPVVHLAWSKEPLTGRGWVAYADFTTGTWRWRQLIKGQSLLVDVPGRNSDSASGAVPLVVMLTGTESARLAKIGIGSNQPPVAVLNLHEPQGPAPLALSATGELSHDPDGVIVRYEYDLDGDGAYEFSSGDPAEAATYVRQSDGAFEARLRVTDELGDSAETKLAYDTGFTARWQTTPGAQSYFTNICPAADGGYYVAGEDNADLLIIRYGSHGQVVWGRRIDNPAGDDFARGVAPAPDGGVYVCARLTYWFPLGSLPQVRWLARINPAGQLLWQRRWEDSDATGAVRGLAAGADGRVFVASTQPMPEVGDASLLCFEPDGQLAWVRGWPAPGQQMARDAAVDAAGNSYLAFFDAPPGAPVTAGLLKFDPGGNTLGKLSLQAGGDLALSSVTADAAGALTLTGGAALGGTEAPCLVRLNAALGLAQAVWFPDNGMRYLTAPRLTADGTLWLMGSQSLNATPDAGLLLRYLPGGTAPERFIFASESAATGFGDIFPQEDGTLLLCGGGSGGTFYPLPLSPAATALGLTLSTALADPQPVALAPEAAAETLQPAVLLPGSAGEAHSGKLYVELLDKIK